MHMVTTTRLARRRRPSIKICPVIRDPLIPERTASPSCEWPPAIPTIGKSSLTAVLAGEVAEMINDLPPPRDRYSRLPPLAVEWRRQSDMLSPNPGQGRRCNSIDLKRREVITLIGGA
jgi:hypothetical protein